MNAPNLFIFGSERSGTTLLCALLSEHPEVCVLNDTFIYKIFNDVKTPKTTKVIKKTLSKVFRQSRLIASSESSNLPAISTYVDGEEVERFFSRLIQNYNPQGKDSWLAEYAERLDPTRIVTRAYEGTLTLQELIETTFFQLLPESQQQKSVLGEKTPIHSYLSDWLHANYQLAKFIILVRHPITNIASIYKRRGPSSLSISTEVYLSYYEDSLDTRLQQKALVVRYEDLVGKPEETLSSIFSYLEVETNNVATSFDYYIKQFYVGSSIDPKRDMKLREMLDEKQKSLVLERCKSILERFYSNMTPL